MPELFNHSYADFAKAWKRHAALHIQLAGQTQLIQLPCKSPRDDAGIVLYSTAACAFGSSALSLPCAACLHHAQYIQLYQPLPRPVHTWLWAMEIVLCSTRNAPPSTGS